MSRKSLLVEDATDKNEELGPAIPDILVENPINWIIANEDTQLKVATDELLKDIKARN